MAELHSYGLHAGAAALLDLLHQLGEINDATCDGDSDFDTRDYRGMFDLVAASLEDHAHHADPAHREGFVRALTDLLSAVADRGLPPIHDGWDPIENTAAAFAAPGVALEAIRRAAQ